MLVVLESRLASRFAMQGMQGMQAMECKICHGTMCVMPCEAVLKPSPFSAQAITVEQQLQVVGISRHLAMGLESLKQKCTILHLYGRKTWGDMRSIFFVAWSVD